MKIRTTIAVMAAKITGHVCKLMGRQGVTWAGKVAMKICPDILEELSSQVREKIFVVCGTNGKTTTNNMLCAGLEAEGKKGHLQSYRFQHAERSCGSLCTWGQNSAENWMRIMPVSRWMRHPQDMCSQGSDRIIWL